MQLYNLSLNPSTAILKCVWGNFSSQKAQEVILAKSRSIQLYTIKENGKLELLCCEELFCVMRTIVAFRYQGTNRDLVMIGSDSGKIIILQYQEHQTSFVKTHEETYGKTGCRRVIPGQYIAFDPRGRAFMVAAVQKQKFVYVMQRKEDKLCLLSPRQAHKSYTICVDVIGLDMGIEGTMSAIFACIQIDYGEVDYKQSLVNTGDVKKNIVYYEMDFGMNTVIRKKEVPVDPTAHMLIAVPGSPIGPGGLLAILEDYLLYRNMSSEQHLVRFPLRNNRPLNRKTQFTTYCSFKLVDFFFLIASELGDLFKIQFLMKEVKGKKQVLSIKIQYFDTVSCLSSMCLSKNGYLFCASEKENHYLYLIVAKEKYSEPIYTHSGMPSNTLVQFQIKNKQQKYLQVSDCIEQYGPITDLKVIDLKNDGNSQIYTLNASGNNSSYLRIIKQGLKVNQLHAIKCYQPKDIWCLKTSQNDEYDRMIVLSINSKIPKTLVLTTTANGYAQTKDTGLQENTLSIHVGRLQDDSIIQILQSGFRHLRKDKIVRTMKFQGKIMKGIVKGRQMVLALLGGDIIYYQLDETGSMSEVTQTTIESGEVIAFDFSPLQKGRIRSNFLAAALSDFTVRIFELSPESCLKVLSTQNMKSEIQSIAIEQMDISQDEAQKYGTQLYLYAGLQNGMIYRTSIDTITGKLTDSRPKYLGSRPVKCLKIKIMGKPAIIALSSRPWLIYIYGKKQMSTLLAFPYISVACQIIMPNKFKHTVMAYCENYLKIIHLESFGHIFHSQKIPLQFSAKKMSIVRDNIVVVQSEQHRATYEQNNNKKWNSLVTVYNPKLNKTINNIEFQLNQICISLCFCSVNEENEIIDYLVLGCTTNIVYHPKVQMQKSSIKVYQWDSTNQKFNFHHSTEIQSAPFVLHSWKQKVLAGIGTCLRAYQIGKKRLLRKAEIKNLHSPVNTIKTWGQRIYATEINDSFHMYKYKANEQTFYDIADDVLNRYITATAILDYHTIIGADKFANIFISRVPQHAEEDFENNPNTYKFRWQNGYLNGAPFKMEQISSFFVGEVVTAIQKTSLVSSGDQFIIYSTINGGIGALCPFETKQDVDFFTHLEMYLRNLTVCLSGRDYLSYRSYYTSCKAVVDGDMCQVYNKLPYQQQVDIGRYLDRTPEQIQKKLQEMRNRII